MDPGFRWGKGITRNSSLTRILPVKFPKNSQKHESKEMLDPMGLAKIFYVDRLLNCEPHFYSSITIDPPTHYHPSHTK